MFEFSSGKLLVVLVVALVVIGPKDLPRVAYALGAFARKVRLMFDDARRGVDEIVRESGGDEADHLVHSIDHEIEAGGIITSPPGRGRAPSEAPGAGEGKPDEK